MAKVDHCRLVEKHRDIRADMGCDVRRRVLLRSCAQDCESILVERRVHNLQVLDNLGQDELSTRAVCVSGASIRSSTSVPARQTASIVAWATAKVVGLISAQRGCGHRVCCPRDLQNRTDKI